MSVALAVYDTVYEHQEGTEAVAAAIGVRKQVLIIKVNLQNSTHHLTLDEAVRLMEFTGDMRVMYALADQFHGTFVPMPQRGDAAAEAVVADISAMSMEFGSLLKEVATDLVDGKITPNEYKRIQREAADLRVALARLMGNLRAIHEAGVKAASSRLSLPA